ncbi:TetR family transcriptional regulator [Corynebacterium poyangense]|uniref:HTH-type transcriptional repressor AcnR n=1 Tax=Corynebacterium poyangense TaxID=2684405 RepID=A0A7H0SNX4_9CORY|nr:TetR/AcrR family transcriptional regulator [Corynebacterium poyangense]MBZ8177810.1 TetR family transcriptional regulator [Corynebacterium poyangense]QNQ90249.1 TetR family transcriptional regulator [Corynebacterium poyangense]
MPIVSDTELTRRRQEILEGARRCFAEHGYEGATVRRLEESTGKSRGAIFHHFGDKENLFLALAREDAARQAEVVAKEGLVQVMRDMLNHPERYDWLSTRLEITRLLRTDPAFKARWQEHQAVLDKAVTQRLQQNAAADRMRSDVPMSVLHTFLETVMEGFITLLASGGSTQGLEKVLDLVEETVRGHSS